MNNTPTILIIFGVSGDLSRRFLLPSIERIAAKEMLPEKFHVIGTTRQSDIHPKDLFFRTSGEYLSEHFNLRQLDTSSLEEFERLGEYLDEIEKKMGSSAQRIFYLSVPPKVSKEVIENLGKSGLSKKGEVKLLLEKPFGINLDDAKNLAEYIDQYFIEDQIYRVDHYMAKETAQNIIVFRNGNSLFKKTWNKDFIDSIEVIASEKIGIEGRANFYEQTGALRDIVQSHLLQLLALTLMDLPENDKYEEVPKLRLDALEKLKIQSVEKDSMRGQYEEYKKEVNNEKSNVETFVSITLGSSDPKWTGVPLTLSTGKALDKKCTEIKILYKKEKNHESNELYLHIQPEEGIQFNMWAKRPGYERNVSPHNLSFKFREHYGILPQAYEQVLYNAINSDHSLFTSGDEVLETWKILDPIQKNWEKGEGKDLIIYKKGSTISEVKELKNKL